MAKAEASTTSLVLPGSFEGLPSGFPPGRGLPQLSPQPHTQVVGFCAASQAVPERQRLLVFTGFVLNLW